MGSRIIETVSRNGHLELLPGDEFWEDSVRLLLLNQAKKHALSTHGESLKTLIYMHLFAV